MLWRYAQHHFHSYGDLWLARGDSQRALSYADECLALAQSSESSKNVVKARRLRGQAFLVQGRLEAAEAELAQALQVARQVGNPPQLWKTLLSVRDLRQAQGRLLEASLAHDEARSVVKGVAAGLTDASLRATFLGSAHVQAMLSATRDTPAQ
jgi:tetratricopeptide (TPR) repeat protein